MSELIFSQQARKPAGFLGRLMGDIMAATNRPRNRWLLDQLDLQAGQTGFEFGFGNGETLAEFLSRDTNNRALGLDWSPAMVISAQYHNKSALAEGRLELRCGNIADPACVIDGRFDRIWCSNVIQIIDNRPALFRRLHGHVAEKGLFAICFQPRGPRAPVPRLFAETCRRELENAGFNRVDVRWMEEARPEAFCLLAHP
ncbi:trans-aconitate 2-methyltransferase [Candidatus Phycosocius bacilliformis]|uniref:Trans-aconitate 2-methyltransferase n=1 Tax=Candidatus Phycosocius bacilliformis TaxID=1445552 RepID=A0A2P2EBY2_9PROT|nr:class I SAM-dependent methyltransferase [Candidatus Phycosocius bacilliformis]GBF58575.1 trans-aconitate 2-methyltransferase [Candidatus Phycosocius bacilliformis]